MAEKNGLLICNEIVFNSCRTYSVWQAWMVDGSFTLYSELVQQFANMVRNWSAKATE